MINLSSFIAFHARRTPARCALKYRGEDISYAAFDDRIRKVAGWLVARGIGPDDVVAVLMKNSTAFLELVFATSHIGAVFLPINYRLSADEVGYIVGNSGARLSDRRRRVCRHRCRRRADRAARRGCAGERNTPCARCRAGADASAPARRSDAADVHVGHHRPPQRA